MGPIIISMDIENLYQKVIEDLVKGKRPHLELSTEQIDLIKTELQNRSSKKELEPILCILDNSRTLSYEFYPGLLNILKNSKDSELLVMCLGASRKHIIECRHKDGHRMEIDFLNTLKDLLKFDHYEVKEWTLRLIESLGSQSIFLKDDVLSIKPKLTIFNEHKKMTKELIELLEKRWTPRRGNE